MIVFHEFEKIKTKNIIIQIYDLYLINIQQKILNIYLKTKN